MDLFIGERVAFRFTCQTVESIVVMLLSLRDGRSHQKFEEFHFQFGFDYCYSVAVLDRGDARNNALLSRN